VEFLLSKSQRGRGEIEAGSLATGIVEEVEGVSCTVGIFAATELEAATTGVGHCATA